MICKIIRLFFALLHGSNPVLFVVSCLASTVLLSMALTYVSTARLDVSRDLPERVFSGAPFDVRLEVSNRSRWRPALGLGFKDAFQISRPGELTCGPTLPVLPPGRTAEIAYRKRIHRRGVYRVVSVVAASRFPFGLFERRVLLRSEPARLVVLPALGRPRRIVREGIGVITHTIVIGIRRLGGIGREGIGIVTDTIIIGINGLGGIQRERVKIIAEAIAIIIDVRIVAPYSAVTRERPLY